MVFIKPRIILVLCLFSGFKAGGLNPTNFWSPDRLATCDVNRLDQLGLSKACSSSLEFWLNSLKIFLAALNANCTASPPSPLCPVEKKIKENLFAVEQLDSFGKIPPELLEFRDYWMGSWEQCLDKAIPEINPSGYKTQFCWLEMVHPTALLLGGQSSTKIVSPIAPDLCPIQKLRARVSVCMPENCTETEITEILKQVLLNFTHSPNTPNTLCGTRCRPSKPPYSTGFRITIIFTGLIGLLMIIATLVDIFTTTNSKPSTNFSLQPLLVFSIYTNGAEILNMERRPGGGQIDVVHCIRVVNIAWVIAIHCPFLMLGAIENPAKIIAVKFPEFYATHFLMNFFSVDSFFFLSGLLLAFTFCKEMQRTPGKMKSISYWILYYVHRFFRLTPPYAIAIAFHAVVMEPISIGPMDYDQENYGKNCRRNWWLHLLYVNNMFRQEQKMCMGHSFYLAADMQMHTVAPILLIPLFAWPLTGGVVGAVLIAVAIATNYIGFYVNHVNDIFGLSYSKNLYSAPWVRCTPYVIGMFVGYFLHRMRNKKLPVHWFLAVILWCISLAILCLCLAGEWKYNHAGGYSIFLRASYYCFSRIGWALALSWIVIACQHGLGGPINNIMSQPFWAPLGKLSYCAYLIHILVITAFLSMERRPVHFTNMAELYIHNAIPCICITFILAFLWSCAFEIPAGKLEKLIVDRVMRKSADNERVKKNDGHWAP